MTVKVSDVMRHVRNHFIRTPMERDWAHVGGTLTPAEGLKAGAWIAVCDAPDAPCGVFQLDEKGGIPDLDDRRWHGVVCLLDPPADFLRLCGDIACWAAANPDVGVTGERLGAYSVTRKALTWEEAFASALAPYRRMFAEVRG